MFRRRKEAQAIAQSSKEVVQFASSLVDEEGSVSETDIDKIVAFAREHGFGSKPTDAQPIPVAAVRIMQIGMATRGRFVEVPSTLLLKPDEVAYCEVPARLLKEVRDREFQGGSRGVSVPLGHGVRVRTGSFRGHMVTVGSHLETADSGTLTVTNKRTVFHGSRKNLEFAFTKLSTLSTYSDAITLGVSNRQNTSTLSLGEPEYVAGMIRAAFNSSARQAKPAASREIAEASDATVHLIEDTHTFEGNDGETIWSGGLAPCTEDGTFIRESEHRTTHPNVLFCKVAGASHRHDALQAAAFAPGSQICLRPEPDNAYDKDAVQILDVSGELFVGYVPAELSREVSARLGATDLGGQVVREFRRGSEQGERIGLHVLIAPAGPRMTLTIHDSDEVG